MCIFHYHMPMSIEKEMNDQAYNELEKELIERFGKQQVEAWKKEFQNATIQNNFVFCKTMQNLEFCAEVLKKSENHK